MEDIGVEVFKMLEGFYWYCKYIRGRIIFFIFVFGDVGWFSSLLWGLGGLDWFLVKYFNFGVYCIIKIIFIYIFYEIWWFFWG